MKEKARLLFHEASNKLRVASEELCRPEEDMVSYVVCKNAQHAIENYLKGFLYQNGVDASHYVTIDSLYAQCLKVNNHFENYDLSDFACTSKEIDASYCDNATKVSRCFEMANKMDSLLRNEKLIG